MTQDDKPRIRVDAGEPEPEQVEIVRPYKDAEGHLWTDEPTPDGQVRVYLQTKDGRALNFAAPDREAGRKHLREFIRSGN